MNEPDFGKLEQELKIDQDDLDTELIKYIENYYDVSRGFKYALEVRDYFKNELKIVDAELQFDVRDALSEEHTKVTEAMVDARIWLESKHTGMVNKLTEAEKDLNNWSCLKDSYEQKSYALARLVELFIAGYFGVAPIKNASSKQNNEKIDRKIELLDKSRSFLKHERL